MAQRLIRTVYKGHQWVNEVEEGAEFGGAHRTKDAAVEAGRTRAKLDGADDVIQDEDGTISERNSYGSDPASRPG